MTPSPSLCWDVQDGLLGLQTDAPCPTPCLPAFAEMGRLHLESFLSQAFSARAMLGATSASVLGLFPTQKSSLPFLPCQGSSFRAFLWAIFL